MDRRREFLSPKVQQMMFLRSLFLQSTSTQLFTMNLSRMPLHFRIQVSITPILIFQARQRCSKLVLDLKPPLDHSTTISQINHYPVRLNKKSQMNRVRFARPHSRQEAIQLNHLPRVQTGKIQSNLSLCCLPVLF